MKSDLIQVVEFEGAGIGISSKLDYKSALGEFNLAKEKAIRSGDLKKAGNASKSLAECYRRTGLLDSAKLEYEKAILLFTEINDTSGILWTKWAKANFLRQTCDYYKSDKILHDITWQLVKYKDVKGVSYTLSGIAENSRIRGYYKISLSQHFYLLKLYEQQKDYRGIVWAKEGIAQIYKNQKNYPIAYKLFDSCIRIAEFSMDLRGLGYAYKGAGECLGYMGQRFKSLLLLQKSIQTFQKIHFRTGEAYALKSMGDIELYYGNFYSSFFFYSTSLQLFEKHKDLRGMAYVKKGLGDYFALTGNKNEALKNYLFAKNFFQEKNINYGLEETNIAIRILFPSDKF